MGEEDIGNSIIIIAILAVLLFISQAFIFTNVFSIGSLVFSAVFCYLMFFIARNSLLHKKDLKDNLKIKDRMNLRIDFWK